MRNAVMLAAVLGAALFCGSRAVQASHNTVTVGAPTQVFNGLTTWTVNSVVQINNTTNNAESGQVTLFLFQVRFDGTVVQLQKQDLGAVTIPAGVGAVAPIIPFRVEVHQPGTYLLLADVVTVGVPHTHDGTMTVIIN